MSISFFCIATEPIKNMYPIKESINSILPLADEIIIVFGREEEETYKYFKNLDKKIKIYNTNKWPIDWSYDVMTYHFDYALKQCTGDICIKVDIDHIYKQVNKNEIELFRNNLLSNLNKNHIIWIPKLNYLPKNKFLKIKRGTYCINKKLLDNENKKFYIGRKKYVNTIIIEEKYNEIEIDNLDMAFLNYDCTFMTRKKLIEKQYYWYNAYLKLFGSLSHFNVPDDILNRDNDMIDFVVNRVKERIKWAQKKTLKGQNYFFNFDFNFNPKVIRERLLNLDENQYGYNYFGRDDIIEILK
jgi:hypothetical protein